MRRLSLMKDFAVSVGRQKRHALTLELIGFHLALVELEKNQTTNSSMITVKLSGLMTSLAVSWIFKSVKLALQKTEKILDWLFESMIS